MLTSSWRRRRPAPWMSARRPNAAAAPRPARPMPPAKTGLVKRASRPRMDGADGAGGVGAAAAKGAGGVVEPGCVAEGTVNGREGWGTVVEVVGDILLVATWLAP